MIGSATFVLFLLFRYKRYFLITTSNYIEGGGAGNGGFYQVGLAAPAYGGLL